METQELAPGEGRVSDDGSGFVRRSLILPTMDVRHIGRVPLWVRQSAHVVHGGHRGTAAPRRMNPVRGMEDIDGADENLNRRPS
jgi:hypothetical protein